MASWQSHGGWGSRAGHLSRLWTSGRPSAPATHSRCDVCAGRGSWGRGVPWSPQEPSHETEVWGPHACRARCRCPSGAGGLELRQCRPLTLGLIMNSHWDPSPATSVLPVQFTGPWCGRPAVGTSALVAGLPREHTCCPRTPRVCSLCPTGFSLSQAGSWVRHRRSSRWAPPAGLLGVWV